MYISDTTILLQQLYARLKELLGLHDHLVLLNVIVGKIATNLKCYTEVILSSLLFLACCSTSMSPIVQTIYLLFLQSEEVIGHTLSLFLELASG